MNDVGRVRVGLGLPSFLVIVTAVALMVLGVLTLNMARADEALQSRYEALSQAYYTAAVKAEETLSLLDEALLEAYLRSADAADYKSACANIIRAGDVDIQWQDEMHAVFYVDAGYERRLCVEMECSAFEHASASRFAQVRRTLEDTMNWSGEAIPLIA